MKKLIAALVVVLIALGAYFGQIYYTSNKVAQAFEKDEGIANSLYTIMGARLKYANIAEKSFTKGFWHSQAKFTLYFDFASILAESGYDMGEAGFFGAMLSEVPFYVSADIKNSMFASENVVISMENPFFDMLQLIANESATELNIDKNLFVITGKISPKKTKLTIKFTDILAKNADKKDALKLDGLVIESELNNENKIISNAIKISDFFINSQEDGENAKFELKKLSFKEHFNEPVGFEGYLAGIYDGQSVSSIESVRVDNAVLKGISTKGNIDIDEKNGVLGIKGVLNIGEISTEKPLIKHFKSDIDIQNLSLSLIGIFERFGGAMSLYMFDVAELNELFFSKKPLINFKEFSFDFEGKKFDSNATLDGDTRGFEGEVRAKSEFRPSELFKALGVKDGDFSEIDGAFAEKDGKFVLNFQVSSNFELTKLFLNGELIKEIKAKK